MSEIKVGEYVRTVTGSIDKVDALYDLIENTIHLENHKWQDIKNIVKHSFNIIDLIEEGDYVNGKEITSVSKYQDKKVVCYTEETYGGISYHIFNKDIKSIVTKEMMESVEYRLEV